MLERQGVTQMNKIFSSIFNKKVVEMNKVPIERFIGKKIVKINDMGLMFVFDGEESLTVECPWRLRNTKTVFLGSSEYNLKETRQETFEKLQNLLLGKKIKEIIITPVISDLKIKFNDDLLLELFSNSNIYESWTLSDGKNLLLISLPGGGGCIFGE